MTVIYSPAKVNLCLYIHQRRTDGYHELSTVMHEIDLCDTISLAYSPSQQDELSCSDSSIPTDHRNLILKGLAALRVLCPQLPYYKILLDKRIPAGGGLAGGSSNTAKLLYWLWKNEKSCTHFLQDQIHELCASLGSDLNFFLVGNTALCTGRGEKVIALPTKPLYFNLLLPPMECSTPEVFQCLKALPPHSTDIQSWLAKWRNSIVQGSLPPMINDLESACLEAYPDMNHYLSLRNSGFQLNLSGSGSTLFSVHEHLEDRDEFHARLTKNFPHCKCIRAKSWTDSPLCQD